MRNAKGNRSRLWTKRKVRNMFAALASAMVVAPWSAQAQNPVIRDQYTADPTARVFNGKVYLYPSHDILPPEGQRKDWFCMADYHVFSSENLTDWKDHGTIVSQEKVPWGNPVGYSMWAPDCVYKNGKYYFYFPNAPKGRQGFSIGVATADHPEGPFVCEPEPIKGVSGIDPCVLIDDDGSAYLYWSGMGIRGAKLKSNMKELDGELQEMRFPRREGSDVEPPAMLVGGQQMEGLPEGFKEGPFAFKRGDWYYLTFPWVRGDTSGGKNPTETLAYSMSKSPLGPWDFKGIIMAEHANSCWTNHHSLVEYKGQWYLFYHHNDLSPNDDKRRSVCIDKIEFNADGTICEVKPTRRGVGINKACERIEIDGYNEASEGVTRVFAETNSEICSMEATLPQKGSWLRYEGIDFSEVKDGYLIISVRANKNTSLCLREKSPHGKVIASLTVTVKSGEGRFRRDLAGQWLMLTAPLEYTPKGITDLVVTCEDKAVSIDWVQFKNRQQYFTESKSALTAKPDEKGFIRRWMLLEPIKQDIRSNVVFTNSYLNEAFNKSYFKGQQTILPKNGQKVKVGKQNLTWHALDSENYNVKLFRFAEKWGQQTYGSLFWGVTVIDCKEEHTGLRLAAGSNGASMWWLNGEEVLLLEGDRRMVEDDGMSARLTLKKGRNILRCAVINGPGLSDFCVRFIDSEGKPFTDFEIIDSGKGMK